MSSRTIAFIAIVTASLFWSTANVVAKIMLRTFDPFPLAFLRFALAAIIMLPFLLRERKVRWQTLLKDVLPIALFSTANIILFYVGLQWTNANASALIYTATPVLSALLAKYFIGEHITRRKFFGIVLGLIGVLIIVLLPIIERGGIVTGNVKGNTLIFIATFVWAVYTVGSRNLISVKHYSPVTISAVSIITSAVVFFIATLILPHRDYVAPLANPINILLIIHLAIIVTVASYLLFQWAIQHSSATTASFSNYLQPVFAVWLAAIILGERLTQGLVVGSVLVIAGVFLATGVELSRQFRKFVRVIFRQT